MTDVRDLLRAEPSGGRFTLDRVDPRGTPGVKNKKAAAERLETLAVELAGLQERLYAERARSLLVVLQGMDTSGKDGTIKHVIGEVNPAGVKITAFGRPTDEERRHDFLWRIRNALPQPGYIGIFNRSHYEDVGVVRVHGLADDAEIERRYGAIADFEAELAGSGTTVVKCFLHLSHDEQRDRLLDRLDDPTKHWKFNERDIDERRLWPRYQEAYGIAIGRCSTAAAPWYVVPADRKWYRNWAVSSLLVETLRELDPRYPDPGLDVAALKKRLEPPN